MSLVLCNDCQGNVSLNAVSCPHCGSLCFHKLKNISSEQKETHDSSTKFVIWFWIFCVTLLLFDFTYDGSTSSNNAGPKRTSNQVRINPTASDDVKPKVTSNQVRSSSTPSEAKEMMATVINLNGHLCAKVIDIVVYETGYVTECVLYRGGSSRQKYRVSLDATKVYPID
jgi:hypothetical protein